MSEISGSGGEYERPGDNWLCGRSLTGEPCQTAPGPDGQCQARFECSPLKKGDRWKCTRPQRLGGECENGPSPAGACSIPARKCTPIKNFQAPHGDTGRSGRWPSRWGSPFYTLAARREIASSLPAPLQRLTVFSKTNAPVVTRGARPSSIAGLPWHSHRPQWPRETRRASPATIWAQRLISPTGWR